MATVNKDFKIKHGLVVEGTKGTINGEDILTKAVADQNYIIGLIGGSATPDADPDTVVLRDENADFSANMITSDLTGDVTGQVSDISNHDTDDLSEGTTNKYYTDSRVKDVLTGATKTNIQITNVAGELIITAENGVADSDTDDLTEGTTNKYFTDTRAKDAVAAALGDGIEYTNGSFDVQFSNGITIGGGTGNELIVDRNEVDNWYEASGAVSTHNDLTTGVHGVTGNVVGTTDTQDLSNKRFIDTVYFTDGVTINNEAEIAVRAESHDFDVQANYGDLHLKTVAADSDVQITSTYGDILLNPNAAGGKKAYYGSASAEHEIATHSYVDNAISGLDWKNAAHVKIDSNVNNLSAAAGTYDGHTLTTADAGLRVLLVGQTTDSQNGIYTISNVAGDVVLTRSTDADAFGELLGAAIYIAEGTQYGGTSWVQSNAYLTDFSGQNWTQFSGQGSVTAGDGITVDGLQVSIDRTTVDDWYEAAGAVSTHSALTTGVHGVSGDVVGTSDSQTLTNKSIDASSNTLSNIGNSSLTNSSIDINGYTTSLGGTVDLDTDDVSETASNQYFTNQRALDATSAAYDATGTAQNLISALSTDDIEEGAINEYFTDARAAAAAAALLTSANQTNISITGTGAGLTITAENGVADSDTDDLTEGTNNLYFSDQRAIDALQNTTPVFSAVDIDSVAKQIAATVSAPTGGSQITAYEFAKADYRSAKFLIKTAYGTHTELTEVLLTLDSSDNIAITEYATIGTNGSSMTVTADIYGPTNNNVRLRVTPVNNDSTITVFGTLLA